MNVETEDRARTQETVDLANQMRDSEEAAALVSSTNDTSVGETKWNTTVRVARTSGEQVRNIGPSHKERVNIGDLLKKKREAEEVENKRRRK